MKRILAFLLIAMLLVCSAVPVWAESAYDINTAKNSVVRIMTVATVTDENYPSLLGLQYVALGSGFVIKANNDADAQYVGTAAHVILHNVDSPDVNQETVWIPQLDGGVFLKVLVDEVRVLVADKSQYVIANVEAFSSRADVAVLKLNSRIPRSGAILMDQRDFGIGEQLTAMGFPTAAEANQASEVTDQLLSDTQYVNTNTGAFTKWDGHANTRQGDQITTTAEMSPGLSGGALVNKDGFVVGVCVAVSTLTSNVNYAVAADELLMLCNSVTGLNPESPANVSKGLSTTTIILIAVGVVVIALLLALIFGTKNSKKNSRTLTLNGAMGGKTVPLKKGVPVVIGRDPNRCQIVYPKDAAGVSSVHCTITYDGNEVTVADNSSSYGTFVGGKKVEPGRPVVMHRGQEVTFGSDKNSAELH